MDFSARQRDPGSQSDPTIQFLERFYSNVTNRDDPKLALRWPLPASDDTDWEAIPNEAGEHTDEFGASFRVVLRDKPGKIKREVDYAFFLCTNVLRNASRWVYFSTNGDEFEKAQMDDIVLTVIERMREDRSAESYERQAEIMESSVLYDDVDDSSAIRDRYSDIYRPLLRGTGNIRLLVLLPSEEKSADLKCILCAACLRKEPKYEALSYTWGDPRETFPILLNGEVVQATKTLVSALRHLRYTEEGKVRVMWIDAVCINQSDVEEKNHKSGKCQRYTRLQRRSLSGLDQRLILLATQ